MADLKSKRLIIAKGFLFLLAGVLCLCIIFMEHPDLRLAVLIGLSIWCFARFYYFAFYVIQRYVDDRYRYAGLFSFAAYLLQNRKTKQE
jgi:hypothetical protein